jgi:hypothetical protein
MEPMVFIALALVLFIASLSLSIGGSEQHHH